jgi:hypothetical protein
VEESGKREAWSTRKERKMTTQEVKTTHYGPLRPTTLKKECVVEVWRESVLLRCEERVCCWGVKRECVAEVWRESVCCYGVFYCKSEPGKNGMLHFFYDSFAVCFSWSLIFACFLGISATALLTRQSGNAHQLYRLRHAACMKLMSSVWNTWTQVLEV